MNLTKAITDLQDERAAIENAIMILERIARGHGKRRGRPPAWMTGTPSPDGTRPKRRRLSAEGRARIARAQRRRWAKRKRAMVPIRRSRQT